MSKDIFFKYIYIYARECLPDISAPTTLSEMLNINNCGSGHMFVLPTQILTVL